MGNGNRFDWILQMWIFFFLNWPLAFSPLETSPFINICTYCARRAWIKPFYFELFFLATCTNESIIYFSTRLGWGMGLLYCLDYPTLPFSALSPHSREKSADGPFCASLPILGKKWNNHLIMFGFTCLSERKMGKQQQ